MIAGHEIYWASKQFKKKDMIIFARVYDTFGRVHLKTNLSSLKNIKLTSLNNGIYFIKLSQDEKNSIYKVLINKL